MPAFNPRAGFSPNCSAVRVQTEHCACTVADIKNRQKDKIRIKRYFFMALRVRLQVTTKSKILLQPYEINGSLTD